MYFEVHKNNNYAQPYWWVMKSLGNHAKLAHSEMYRSKSDCLSAMAIVARGAGNAKYYDKTGE